MPLSSAIREVEKYLRDTLRRLPIERIAEHAVHEPAPLRAMRGRFGQRLAQHRTHLISRARELNGAALDERAVVIVLVVPRIWDAHRLAARRIVTDVHD